MRINVNAKDLEIKFMSTFDGVLPIKKEFNSDSQAVDANGKPLFSGSALQCLRFDENGRPSGTDNGVSLAVRTPTEVAFGRVYGLTGSVVINHYVAGNGRLGCSIQADGLEETDNRGSGLKLNVGKGE